MSRILPTLFKAEQEFKTKADVLNKYLLQSKLSNTALESDNILTPDMYTALEARFARDLAKRRIEKCLATKDAYLDIGNCGLTDDDFAEGKVLDTLLSQCVHIETLIISNRWSDDNEEELVNSRNKRSSNVFSKMPAAVVFCTGLKKLIAAGFVNAADKHWTIGDLSPLVSLSGLLYLDVSENQIKETQKLETLRALKTLYLYGNQIKEIKGLETLKALQKLNLADNKIIEITVLHSLSSLKWLVLSYNRITEIKGLESLSTLENLHLTGNKIIEIKGLETLTFLRSLDLIDNQIKELKGLDKLTNLEILNIGNNQITQLKGLETLVALQHIWLAENKIFKIKGLKFCKALLSLVLSSNKITEIEGLESLALLESLSLSNNLINEVKGLEQLSRLKKVDLSNNNITRISDFQFVLNLTADLWINVYGNPVILKYQFQLQPQKNDLPFLKELLLRDSSTSKQKLTYPVKILLLGNHAAGKSTLVNYFFGAIPEGSTHILRIEYYLVSFIGCKKKYSRCCFLRFWRSGFLSWVISGIHQSWLFANHSL